MKTQSHLLRAASRCADQRDSLWESQRGDAASVHGAVRPDSPEAGSGWWGPHRGHSGRARPASRALSAPRLRQGLSQRDVGVTAVDTSSGGASSSRCWAHPSPHAGARDAVDGPALSRKRGSTAGFGAHRFQLLKENATLSSGTGFFLGLTF